MKSHERDLLEVATTIYLDVCSKCTAVKVDLRDLGTLRSRLEHEGLSFLTISLPAYGQDFERSLDRGWIEPADFRSFRKNGRIPAFLRGIVAQVFDVDTGRLYDEPSIEAIEGIRQMAFAFKKLRADCTPYRVQKAIDGYLQCERELESPIDPGDAHHFNDVCRVLWGSVLHDVSMEFAYPKHGPGATYERIAGNRKFIHKRWHERLEVFFPLLGTGYPLGAALEEEFEKVTFVEKDDEYPVRVITVPKTLKGPRVIAVEPVCMQYTQQMVSSVLVRTLESHCLTRGHVNFTDQSVNRSLALKSSKTRHLSTLDLSSASDRVPLSLALDMFQSNPDLRDAIEACRTTSAKLPNGEIIPLRKFASMGSALCFPVEAMYFFTVCIAILLEKHGLPVTWKNVKYVSSMVYIYGDDIIVPTDAAVAVVEGLTRYKCKVNVSKSFYTGRFRESCGMDAYDGVEVTPTYVRCCVPRDRLSPKDIVSSVATSNLFYERGYWRTSDLLKRKIERVTGKLPVIGRDSPGLGWISYMGIPRYPIRGRYQRPEVRTWVPDPVYRKDKLDGYAALAKSLLNLEAATRRTSFTSTSKDHLSRTARSGVVTLKRRWVPAA